MSTIPKPPAGSGPSARKLWRDVCERYVLEEHESRLLVEMCRTVDRLDELHAVVEAEGLMVAGPGLTRKVHPAAIEARQVGIALARLSAALRLPAGDEDGGDQQKGARRPQRRVGARGVYAIRGGAA